MLEGLSIQPLAHLQNPGKAIWNARNYFFVGIGEITYPKKMNPETVIN